MNIFFSTLLELLLWIYFERYYYHYLIHFIYITLWAFAFVQNNCYCPCPSLLLFNSQIYLMSNYIILPYFTFWSSLFSMFYLSVNDDYFCFSFINLLVPPGVHIWHPALSVNHRLFHLSNVYLTKPTCVLIWSLNI